MLIRKQLILLSIMAIMGVSAFPQETALTNPLPMDPTVRTGRLSNGLTYYLRQNPKPEKRLLLQLAVNAGSVNENDSQQGLAHFVEHMCFNGTKTWKGNDLINMLESMGVRFGDGLNAYTSFDQTVYILEIPTDNPDHIANGFRVIEEWAHQVSMEADEIEKERGVILEEWRLGLGASERMREKYFPIVLKGSRYAERYIIGKEEILRTFPHDTLRSFYNAWYRPDNMAVIAVGDLDVDELERRLNSHFAAIPKAEGPLNRIEYDVPDNQEPLVSIVTDPEAGAYQAVVYFKHPAYEVKSYRDYQRKLFEQIYTSLLTKRLAELSIKPEAPFTSASASIGSFYSRLTNAYSLSIAAKENQIAESLKMILAENERVRQFGFTQAELDREKKAIMTNLESAVKEADKLESEVWASRYISHFLIQSPAMNAEQTQQVVMDLLPTITLDDLHNLARELNTEENIVVLAVAPEKEGTILPTESEIIDLIRSSRGQKLEPYADELTDAPLLSNPPQRGTIVKRIENEQNGCTEVTFSNGAMAILKPTDFKNDEINFSAHSWGGLSLLEDQDYLTGTLAMTLLQQGGLGQFDQPALRKKLTGTRANVTPAISDVSEGLTGFSNVKDFETLLQLNYLWFTSPRKDKAAFQSTVERLETTLKNFTTNPQYLFMDSINKLAYGGHPRAIVIPPADELKKITLERVYEIGRERFSDASDFKFFFVGSFNTDEILPLLELYIGGLPSLGCPESVRDVTPKLLEGPIDASLALNSEYQSMVLMYFNGQFEFTDNEEELFKIMMQTMSIKLREQMREEQGGVYGVSFQENLARRPRQEFTILANWGCSPETVETLTQTVFAEMERIKLEGPSETDLAKVRETLIKDYEKNIRQNGFWMGSLQDYYLNGEKIRSLEEYKAMIESVTVEDIRAIAQKYLTPAKYIKGVLMPK
ncbi:MAG: insulinase family protein [Bacteroidales bacterium]|nr:insulinase family protein [Bacteroidales bacterium]